MKKWSTLKKLIWLYAAKLKGGASAIIETITGNLPLVLRNAVSHAIVSLTRYGLCTQATTPTPSAPVDIKCNNGVLRMVDDELPAGYKRVLGFLCKNDAYWEIPDFPLYGSDTLRFSFEATESCNVIGVYSGSASGNNYSLYVSQSSNYLRYKNGAYNSTVDFGTRYDVEITPTGSSGMKVDSTWTAQTFTTPTNFCIGTTAVTASSAKLKGNLYGNIEVVGRAKFIPCERISDNVLGYYDLIGETFYMPTYGTPTSLGYDYDHVHVEVVGTPEVLTVSGPNQLSRDGETTGYIITAEGNVSKNASYYISAPFTLSAGNYVCTWQTGSGSRPFSVFAVDESGTPQSDGKLFYQQNATAGINTGEFTVEAETLVVASYRRNATDLAIYSHQTATVPTLLSVGDVKDEAEIISGVVTRRVTACLYDGTQPVGDVYMSTTGGKDAGAIIVYPLATPTTESVTPQPLNTTEGTNIIDSTSNVSPIDVEVEYAAKKGA